MPTEHRMVWGTLIAAALTVAVGCGENDEPASQPTGTTPAATTSADVEDTPVLAPRPVAIERDSAPDTDDAADSDAADSPSTDQPVQAEPTRGAATPIDAVRGFIDACRAGHVDDIRALTIADTPRRKAGLDYLIQFNEAHLNAAEFVARLRKVHGDDADPTFLDTAPLSHITHMDTDDPVNAEIQQNGDTASVRTKKYTYNLALVDGRWFIDLDVLGLVVTAGRDAVPTTQQLVVHTVYFNADNVQDNYSPKTLDALMRVKAMLAASIADRYISPPRISAREPGDDRLQPPLDLLIDLDIAITTHDEAALSRLIDQSTPAARAGYQVFLKQIRSEAAHQAFTKAVTEKFSPVGLARLTPPQPFRNSLTPITRHRSAAKAEINGNRAAITFSDYAATALRRDGRWRIDLSDYPMPRDYVGSPARLSREIEIFTDLMKVSMVENAKSIPALNSTQRLFRVGLYTGLDQTHPITDADRAAAEARKSVIAAKNKKTKPAPTPAPASSDTITTDEGSTITPD